MSRLPRTTRSAAIGVAAIGLGGLAVAGSTVATAQSGYPTCRTPQLTVWRGEPGSGTAGSVYYELQFSNVSRATCSLYGFPGVSAVNSRGAQLGIAAARDNRFAPTRVVLAPGTTAHTVLRIVDVTNFSPAACGPTTAAALKIYPPDRRDAKVLSFRFRACAKSGPVYLFIRTTRPRAGVPGYSQ